MMHGKAILKPGIAEISKDFRGFPLNPQLQESACCHTFGYGVRL